MNLNPFFQNPLNMWTPKNVLWSPEMCIYTTLVCYVSNRFPIEQNMQTHFEADLMLWFNFMSKSFNFYNNSELKVQFYSMFRLPRVQSQFRCSWAMTVQVLQIYLMQILIALRCDIVNSLISRIYMMCGFASWSFLSQAH